MTFLNPLVLLGLLAAAIPILLHLFNLRKLRTIEFSTLTFLKELQKTKIRRIKIRQWLLLLFRTLLVILLVMAFARPTVRGSLSGIVGERAKTTAVFILDDTPSMTASDDQGEYLQQSVDAASRVAALMTDGDEVYLLKLSSLSQSATATDIPPIRNLHLLQAALRETKPTFRHHTLEDALRLSARLVAASTNLNREVYLFSDFQEGGITSASSSALAPESLFPESVRFFAVQIGKRQLHNIGIESIAIPTTMFEPGKAFPVRVRLLNASENAVEGFIVSLFLNGERVTQKGVDIPGRSSAEVEFTAVPKSAGILEGMVELESDDVDFDNRRYFTVDIPISVRVLLVGTSADLQYVRLALGTREAASASTFQIRETTTERLTASDILASDVILFSNPRDLTVAQTEQLSAFLDGGRGIMIFPGSQTQPATFNADFAVKLKSPTLLGIEQLRPDPARDEIESFVTFDRVDLRHPVFQGMFEEDHLKATAPRQVSPQRAIETPKVKTFARFQLPPTARTVMTLSNGVPFLVEVPALQGRILLFAVAPNLDWSDFPLKGLFVPLVHRAVAYLAAEQPVGEVFVGEEVLLRTKSSSTEKWTILSPTKVETVVQPVATGIERLIRFRDTETPGIYTLQSGTTTVRKFAVNPHPDESKTATADAAELDRIYRRLGIAPDAVQTVEPTEEIQRTVLQARHGVELWKHFLLAALIIAIVEMLVARESKRDLASIQPSAS